MYIYILKRRLLYVYIIIYIYIYQSRVFGSIEHLLILILQYDRSRLIITHIALYINESIYKLEYTYTYM